MRNAPIVAAMIKRIRTVLALILVGSLVVFTGCSPTSTAQTSSTSVSKESTTPSSYEEVYDAIHAIDQTKSSGTSDGGSELSLSEDAPLSSNSESTSDMAAPMSSDKAYSETNVQVAGVDEGDIVKTDGTYIYVASGSYVVITRADGTESKEIAKIKLDGATLGKTNKEEVVSPTELYIQDTTLVVVYAYFPDSFSSQNSSSSGSSSNMSSAYWSSRYRTITEAALFDVSDAANPVLLTTMGQDGMYSSSRLHGGMLYLISNKTVGATSDLIRNEPSTYVPLTYTGSESEAIAVPDICILPDITTTTYAVVCSIDISNSIRIDRQAILGASSTVYMSTENLYLTTTEYSDMPTKTYKDGSFTVTEYTEAYTTLISKLSLNKGDIEMKANTAVLGTLLNQFSLDEHNGYLRAVTTVNAMRYRTLDDGKSTLYDYNFDSEPTTNALYVLDKDLNEVGSITGLAEDERVYSVRFDGDIGYFVTFRETDPLFAVDLSNPKNPEVKSALKIPGFSSYLHIYDTDRLFGLGQSANERGITNGLKLSMFDTSDPYNVTELHTLTLEDRYSVALSNHKAIFVSQPNNIIGFPTENGYAIYGYDDVAGFSLRKTFESSEANYYSYNERGLFIGNYLYICSSDHIGVYSLDTLDEVTTVTFDIEARGRTPIMPLGFIE